MLPSNYRIPRQEITLLMRRGIRVRGEGVELIYRIQNVEYGMLTPRFSFVVSTKVDKRATARNRLRRLMSESVRLFLKQGDAPAIDGIFVARRELVGKTQEEVATLVEALLGRVSTRS